MNIFKLRNQNKNSKIYI